MCPGSLTMSLTCATAQAFSTSEAAQAEAIVHTAGQPSHDLAARRPFDDLMSTPSERSISWRRSGEPVRRRRS